MPRRARIDAPGALHHVIMRGIERRSIFRDDHDRDDFLTRLEHILVASATPCYAWALMTNHVHLLVRTATVPLATLMRRLLTGYAVTFNRRHRRHGQLFQNRYKSILCQEDTYLLELVRYIHLNPVRARIVSDIKALDSYPYTGHSALMGKQKIPWQDIAKILGMFSNHKGAARKQYRTYVHKGIELGKRPELVGGGLIRSVGGWQKAKDLAKDKIRMKGDERILGDSDFVLSVLAQSEEKLNRGFALAAKGIDVDAVAKYVAAMYELESDQILTPGSYPKVVEARSILCYWAVRELGISTTELARTIGISQPAISISVKRGEKIVNSKKLKIDLMLE